MLTSQLGSLLANVSGRDFTTCERSGIEQCGLKWGSRSVGVELWNVVSDHGALSYYLIHLCHAVLQAALKDRGADSADKKTSWDPHEKLCTQSLMSVVIPHTKCSWRRAPLTIRIYKKGNSWELNITSTLSVAMVSFSSSVVIWLLYCFSLVEVLWITENIVWSFSFIHSVIYSV